MILLTVEMIGNLKCLILTIMFEWENVTLRKIRSHNLYFLHSLFFFFFDSTEHFRISVETSLSSRLVTRDTVSLL